MNKNTASNSPNEEERDSSKRKLHLELLGSISRVSQ